MLPFPEWFATERLHAERLRESHFADLLRMHADPVHMAMLGGVRDEVETRAYLDRNLKHWADHGFGMWMLRTGSDGPVIGRALLRHLLLEGRDEIEVGYGFDPEYWGRGLATEIAAACVGWGRDTMGLNTIVAITTPDNAGSQRVLTKVGLAYQGIVLHEGRPHALFRVRY